MKLRMKALFVPLILSLLGGYFADLYFFDNEKIDDSFQSIIGSESADHLYVLQDVGGNGIGNVYGHLLKEEAIQGSQMFRSQDDWLRMGWYSKYNPVFWKIQTFHLDSNGKKLWYSPQLISTSNKIIVDSSGNHICTSPLNLVAGKIVSPNKYVHFYAWPWTWLRGACFLATYSMIFCLVQLFRQKEFLSRCFYSLGLIVSLRFWFLFKHLLIHGEHRAHNSDLVEFFKITKSLMSGEIPLDGNIIGLGIYYLPWAWFHKAGSVQEIMNPVSYFNAWVLGTILLIMFFFIAKYFFEGLPGLANSRDLSGQSSFNRIYKWVFAATLLFCILPFTFSIHRTMGLIAGEVKSLDAGARSVTIFEKRRPLRVFTMSRGFPEILGDTKGLLERKETPPLAHIGINFSTAYGFQTFLGDTRALWWNLHFMGLNAFSDYPAIFLGFIVFLLMMTGIYQRSIWVAILMGLIIGYAAIIRLAMIFLLIPLTLSFLNQFTGQNHGLKKKISPMSQIIWVALGVSLPIALQLAVNYCRYGNPMTFFYSEVEIYGYKGTDAFQWISFPRSAHVYFGVFYHLLAMGLFGLIQTLRHRSFNPITAYFLVHLLYYCGLEQASDPMGQGVFRYQLPVYLLCPLFIIILFKDWGIPQGFHPNSGWHLHSCCNLHKEQRD